MPSPTDQLLITLRAAELKGFGGATYQAIATATKRHVDRTKKHVAEGVKQGLVSVTGAKGRGQKSTVRLTAKGRIAAEAARATISAPGRAGE